MDTPSGEPASLQEWLWRVKLYEADIFVRQGKENVALRDLPPKEWARYVAGWIESGAIHVRVRTEKVDD